MDCSIRRAVIGDAGDVCYVVRRSIIELCTLDHHDDEAAVAAWVANKTPANFEGCISTSGNVALVAQAGADIIGFALLLPDATVALLYVLPEARFSGVSEALLAALEKAALADGMSELRLASTETARGFYLRHGYIPAGEASVEFGWIPSYPMSKRLAP